MADTTALGRIGLMLAAATVFVMTAGAVVVGDHLPGRLQIDDTVRMVTPPTAAR